MSVPQHIPLWAAVVLAVLVVLIGCIMIVQTAVNSRLGAYIGSGLFSSCANMVIGSILLAFVLIFSRDGLFRGWAFENKITGQKYVRRWYDYLGGTCGAVYATIAIIVSPLIGFALYAPISVSGQIVVSVYLDHIGFLGAPKKPFGILKAIALIVLFAGLGLMIYQASHTSSVSKGEAVYLAFISLLAGFSMPLQTSINANLAKKLSGQRIRATFVSFLAALVTVLAVSLVLLAVYVHNGRHVMDFHGTTWWMYMGGVIGCVHVYAGIKLAPIIGLAGFFVCVIAGQMAFSLILDVYGIFGFEKRGLQTLKVVGIGLVFCGGAIVQLANWRLLRKVQPIGNAIVVAAIVASDAVFRESSVAEIGV